MIVAHPFRQHSFELAKALEEQGVLVSYCTTVYDKPGTFMGIVKKMLNKKWRNKALGRKSVAIPNEKIVLFCELRGYLALFINRFSKNVNFTRCYQRYLYRCFGKKVANYAKKINVDAVITFDTTATVCFRELRNSRILKVLDMAAITRKYAKFIYETEEKQYGFSYFHDTQRYLWNDKILNYMNEEIELADEFIVASDFTRRSLNYCGIKNDNITIIPYGVNLKQFYPRVNQKSYLEEPMKIVFVGHVDYQKGLHHLFEALKDIELSKIKVDIYGVYNGKDKIVKMGKEYCNAEFHGFVNPKQLREIYQNSDIMIFPSTNDGYGLVILEALACGLPVICSRNAGASDVIQDGVNGFKFNSGDIKRLRDLITWCVQNREELQKMKRVANKSIERNTWENYYTGVNEWVQKKLG